MAEHYWRSRNSITSVRSTPGKAPALRLASKAECARTPDDERWRICAAQDILEHGCLGEEFPSFLTSYGYSRYLAGRP